MRLRYHLQQPDSGFLFLEQEPQYRTLLLDSQVWNAMRFPVPRMLFIVRYIVRRDSFIYPGFYDLGLRVCCIEKPLISFQDRIYQMPTDCDREGLVCTNHAHDGKEYKSLSELASSVIEKWYGSRHRIPSELVRNWTNILLGSIPLRGKGRMLRNYFSFRNPDILNYMGLYPSIPQDAVPTDEEFEL
jgi:hypothetical protein